MKIIDTNGTFYYPGRQLIVSRPQTDGNMTLDRSHVVIRNPSLTTPQSMLVFQVDPSVLSNGIGSGLRCDHLGNLNFHGGGGSQGYQFYGTSNWDEPICGLTYTGVQIKRGWVGAPALACLHIGPGETTENSAPFRIDEGLFLDTPEPGVVEYAGATARFAFTEGDSIRRYPLQAQNDTKTTGGAPYANDGYVTVEINGTTVKLMTTA